MKQTFSLDFKELTDRASKGYGFQALVAEIGRTLGYGVIEGGIGPGDGADHIFEIKQIGPFGKEVIYRWAVSCKDNSVAGGGVSKKDVADTFNTVSKNDCQGYLLACTTHVSQPALDDLRGLETGQFKILIHVWDKNTLEKILHENEQLFEWTLVRFFPDSYNSTRPLTLRAIENLFEIIQGEDEDDDDTFVNRVLDICHSTQDRTIRFRFGEALLYRLTKERDKSPAELHQLMEFWLSSPANLIPKEREFQEALAFYLNELCSGDIECRIDDELAKMGELDGCNSASVEIAKIEPSGNDFLIQCETKFSLSESSSVQASTALITLLISESSFKVDKCVLN